MRILSAFIFFILVINQPLFSEMIDQKIAHACFADLSILERVEAYYDILRSINRGQVGEEHIQKFATNVLGFVRQYSASNVQVARALSDLIRGILISKNPVLQVYAKEMGLWRDTLESHLRQFALAHGNIVRVRFASVPEKNLAILNGDGEPSAEIAETQGLSAFFKLALRGASADLKTQQIVEGGSNFDLMPLYVERSGVACSLDDGYSVQLRGDVFANIPTATIQNSQDVLPFNLLKREKIPAYTGESLFVAHPGCGQWSTIMDRVDESSLVKMENDNILQALNRIRSMTLPLEKMRWLYVLRNNFNSRITAKNYSVLFKQLSAIFGLRARFDKETLFEARRLLFAYKSKDFLKDYDRHFTEWMRDINVSLESYALKFSDVVSLKSAQNKERALCIAPYVKGGATGYSREVRLGLGDVSGIDKKNILLSMISPVGKQGVVRFGDEVEITFPHVDGGELRCVLISGEQPSEARVVGLPLEEIDSDADTIFVLDRQGGEIVSTDFSPIISGDSFLLRSKKTTQVLVVQHSASGTWSMMVPMSDIQAKREHTVMSFCFELQSGDDVQKVVEQSFYDHLALVRKETSYLGKMGKLMFVLDALSPKLSLQDRTDFWDILSGILADKKHMNEQELSRLSELLQKIVVVAQANNISTWVVRAHVGLRDVDFHKKMKKALENPGMSRFEGLLNLSPEVKNVSLEQAQVFFDELAILRRNKKDQSRAAKLLLLHVSDEFGTDLRMTGSGNLLVP